VGFTVVPLSEWTILASFDTADGWESNAQLFMKRHKDLITRKPAGQLHRNRRLSLKP
jgi:hypothetical protein